MLSFVTIQPKIHAEPSKLPSQSLLLKPLKNSTCSIKPKTSHLHLPSISGLKMSQSTTTKVKLSASPVEPILDEEKGTLTDKEILGVVVKPMEKPRVVLKFIWMQKLIGVALDQVIPGHGTIPLSPYHFWPRQDAWEQLKVLLESKPWISRRQLAILLNQATDIINLWQESGGNL